MNCATTEFEPNDMRIVNLTFEFTNGILPGPDSLSVAILSYRESVKIDCFIIKHAIMLS